MKELKHTTLRQASSGDMQAFEALVLHYEKLVYNIAYRMFANAEDAKDMTQETFIKVFQNIKYCLDIKYLKSWICKITVNTCIDELRRRKNKMAESLDAYMAKDEYGEVQFLSDTPTPEDVFLNQELQGVIIKAIYRLPEDYKILIILRDIHEFSYNDIAFIADINIGTVKSRLNRARNKLKTLYLQEQNKHKSVKEKREELK